MVVIGYGRRGGKFDGERILVLNPMTLLVLNRGQRSPYRMVVLGYDQSTEADTEVGNGWLNISIYIYWAVSC